MVDKGMSHHGCPRVTLNLSTGSFWAFVLRVIDSLISKTGHNRTLHTCLSFGHKKER